MLYPSIYFKCSTTSNVGCRTSFGHNLSLNEMFGEHGHSSKQETMRQIYNTKMAKGTSISEHCLRMTSHLNTLEVLGADIDGESQVDMTL